MGVLGLVPFIQKHCPEVIKELPHRFKTLSGKTIAIDGTLITQRLHFSPMPYPNRHVLGWHRVVRELQKANVGVICVFDGEGRSSAKKSETDRRRKMQRMQVARGAMEADRLQRLQNLTKLFNQYQNFSDEEKDRSADALRKAIHRVHVYNATGQFPNSPEPCVSQQANVSLPDVVRQEEISGVTASSVSKMKAVNTLQDVITPQIKHSAGSSKLPQDAGSKNEVINKRDVQRKENDRIIDDQIELKAQDTFQGTMSTRQITNARPTDNQELFEQASTSYLDNTTLRYSDIVRVSPETNVTATPVSEASLEELQDAENQSFAAFEDFFELPRNTYLDTYGKISMLHPYVVEPPYGVPYEDEGQTVHSTNMSVDISDDIRDVEDVVKDLVSLFKKYEQSIPILMATPLVDAFTGGSQDEAVNVVEQYAMSKNQTQLTIEEGRLWNLLAERASQHDLAGAEEILHELARRSESLTKSYEVRNDPVTPQKYEESKYILRAMGVPCINADLPYEAEAVAASLVHNGYADLVASEDTDVLVYEAPLLRNITNQKSPVTVLSGADIRRVLQLDRASYLDFVLLLGTDFSQRVKNIGPTKAIRLIREYGRIEQVIANEPKFLPRTPPEIYLKQVATARVIFETLPPVPDPRLLQPTETNDEIVAAVLAEFGVYRASLPDWNYSAALEGNYFNDNPRIL